VTRIPDIGLGTGGSRYLSGDECVDIVSTALEMGYRHVDTAQGYENEEAVGRGIARADVPREEIVVATKIDEANLAAEDVHRTVRESARRLGLDVLNLIYVHFPRATYDPEETIPALCELVEDGLIRYIGVSNFSPEAVDEALAISDHPIVAHQFEMHPLYRRDDLVQHARSRDMYAVAYSPLAQGEVFDVPEISTVAEKHGCSEAAATLAWLIGKERVAAIPKTTSNRHLGANLDATALKLEAEDVDLIDSIDRDDPIYME
jgi:2,5-diketo-D-gluconate reductase B